MCYKVLLVDDDASLVKSMVIYLSNQGFKIKSANTVKQALELIDDTVDLIILDIVMPKVNGFSFIKLLQKNKVYKNIPFIFLTAKGMTRDRIRGYDIGCYGYLVKPFDPEELVSLIKNISKHTSAILPSPMIGGQHNISHVSRNCENFSYTEKKVLKLLMLGMTNKEIAYNLSFTIRNVEKYVSRLLMKTSTKNRTQLAQYCYGLNLDDCTGE